MLTLVTLVPFAVAAPPSGYSEVKSANDCKIYKGPAGSDGVVPVYAECHWKEVGPDKLHALQGDWEGHARVFETVRSSKIVKTDGERSLVYQVHALSSVSDREVEIWMWKEPIEGGFAYKWKSEGAITPKNSGNVATARHEGWWKVAAHPEGGSRVEYKLIYDPGGSVPGFLVRWFQASGTVATTEQLRAAAKP